MICAGCCAIEVYDVAATDGSRVCTYCPHRATTHSITKTALNRLQKRRNDLDAGKFADVLSRRGRVSDLESGDK